MKKSVFQVVTRDLKVVCQGTAKDCRACLASLGGKGLIRLM